MTLSLTTMASVIVRWSCNIPMQTRTIDHGLATNNIGGIQLISMKLIKRVYSAPSKTSYLVMAWCGKDLLVCLRITIVTSQLKQKHCADNNYLMSKKSFVILAENSILYVIHQCRTVPFNQIFRIQISIYSKIAFQCHLIALIIFHIYMIVLYNEALISATLRDNRPSV